MTAEVAILNRNGIAIAADSAVTIGEQRVWKTTNKIFSLGPRNDIAVMVYGSGDFSGFPWEIVIKSFKSQNSNQFETVEECKSELIEYLSHETWHNPVQERLCPLSIVARELEDLREEVEATNSSDFRKQVKHAISTWKGIAEEQEIILPELKREDFRKEFRNDIVKFRKLMFDEHFPNYLEKLLEDYLFEYLRRAQCETGYESGVVVCGYGKKETFPSLHEVIVDGRYNGKVRAWASRTADLNADPMQPAQIIPFAQRDMTNLFMEGISLAYRTYFISILESLLERKSAEIVDNFSGTADEKLVERKLQERTDQEIVSKVRKDLLEFRANKFVQPLMQNVQGLPREEMAAMAESLVELTSLRRKIDSTVQSVAGPVDVAFISKPDGLVWMKRKHYFDRKFNEEFFMRKTIGEKLG